LALSLFIFRFSVGPLLWAPLSESAGKKIPFFISFLGMAAFSAGCAVAKNIEALLILYFFVRTIGSPPITNVGGVISDMFSARD
jgi:MFS family permease